MEIESFLKMLLFHSEKYDLVDKKTEKKPKIYIDSSRLSEEDTMKNLNRMCAMTSLDNFLFETEEIFYLRACKDFLLIKKSISEEEKNLFFNYCEFWFRVLYHTTKEKNKEYKDSFHQFCVDTILYYERFKNNGRIICINDYEIVSFKIYIIVELCKIIGDSLFYTK